MSEAGERRPFLERLMVRLLRPPFADLKGRKGWFGLLARAQPHVVRHYSLALPGWPRFQRPLRIALLTDHHVGSHTGDIARHTLIAKQVATLRPDVVLFGGDYVNMMPIGGGRIAPKAIAWVLGGLTGRHGRFAILGNHDYAYGEQEVTEALRARDIAVLDHERGTFMFEKHAIDVVGVPDAHLVRPRAKELLASLAPDRPTIVLAHDPVWFRHVPEGPFLMLAGHTHGGQIRLPGLGVVTNASDAPLGWSHGLVVQGNRHLIVTAGLGSGGIPLRIGVPPEFAVIDVTGA